MTAVKNRRQIAANRIVRQCVHCRGSTHRFSRPRCCPTSPSLPRFKNLLWGNRCHGIQLARKQYHFRSSTAAWLRHLHSLYNVKITLDKLQTICQQVP